MAVVHAGATLQCTTAARTVLAQMRCVPQRTATADLTERGSSRVTASMSLKSAPARRYDFHMYSK